MGLHQQIDIWLRKQRTSKKANHSTVYRPGGDVESVIIGPVALANPNPGIQKLLEPCHCLQGLFTTESAQFAGQQHIEAT